MPTNTMEEFKEKAREEFEEKFNFRWEAGDDTRQDEQKFWLSKLDEAIKVREGEIIEKISKLKRDYTKTYPNPIYYQDKLAENYNGGIKDSLLIINQDLVGGLSKEE